MKRERDIRSMLLSMGIGEVTATLAIPYMFFLPRTTDPAAQGVQVIVRGLQKGLRKLGSPVQATGWLGPDTARAIRLVSGDGWFDKAWVQIYGDVLGAQKEGWRIPLAGVSYGYGGLSGFDIAGGVCKPNDNETLALWKGFQLQLNRIAHMQDRPKIDEDGRIGTDTLGLFDSIFRGLNYTSCSQLGDMVSVYLPTATNMANSLGAPATVPVPSRSRPSVPGPAGKPIHPPEGLVEMITSPLGLAALALGAVFWFKRKKR